MRNAFSVALVEIAQRDSKVLLLTGDHGYALFDDFINNCPTQYINAGIAEQNMVGVAAGLARSGFKPIVYGLSAFVPIRVLEQIKIDVCHDNLPVTFIGDGAGFVYSHLGTSHQSTEDIACTRSLPNLTIFSPADRFEMTGCMELAYQLNQPVYLRMGKSDMGDVHDCLKQFNVGDVLKVKAGSGRIHFFATGSMVKKAVEIAEHYKGAGVSSVPTIKTVNADQIAEICRDKDLIVTMEEHSVMGGVGSVIAEIVIERVPVRICRIGINDRFSEHCGSYAYLINEHQLDHASIQARIDDFLRLIV
jgi:transketolase